MAEDAQHGMAGRQERHYPTSDNFDAFFGASGSSVMLRRIWREAYGDESPEVASPSSFVTRSELRYIAQALGVGPGQTIVDLACGLGGPGLWVARETGTALIGVDFSPVAIEIARRTARDQGLDEWATFIVADAAATGLPDAAAAGMLSIDAFQLFPDPAPVLWEAARLLPSAGRFVFTTLEPRGSSRLAAYRTLLDEAGLALDAAEEIHDLEYRVRTFQGILAAQDALITELGERAEQTVLAEAREAQHWLAHMRHMRLVAHRR